MRNSFRSLSYKLSSGLAVSTIIPLLIFCIFFYSYMSNAYHQRYIEQSKSSMAVSVNNINHYVETCITSALSIYYNTTVQNILLSGDPKDFMSVESNESVKLLSYMLSVYAATPDAVQIHLAAYRLNKSFLVTTSNLQKYVKTEYYNIVPFESTKPNNVFIDPVHTMHHYNHFVTYISKSSNSSPRFVFTINLPIYILPSSKDVIGMLSIDMPISFIENNCKITSYESEQNYVVDKNNNIVFSPDPNQIGKKIEAGSILDLFCKTITDDSDMSTQKINDLIVIGKKFDSNFLDWYLIKTVPKQVIYQDLRVQLIILLVIFGVCLISAVILNSISVLRYTTPLNKATRYMEAVKNQQYKILNKKITEYVSYNHIDEIGMLLKTFENMLQSINDSTINQYKLDIANKTTELKMLQAQINPHFIYNTLQFLATMSLKNNDREQYGYITSLGQMMRYSMDTGFALIRLEDEIAHVERYIQLQKLRFNNKLEVIWDINPDSKKITVPKMILQPLIENSIKHGNIFQLSNGRIITRSHIDENFLHIYVIDNGVPISEGKIKELNSKFNNLKIKYNISLDYNYFLKNTNIYDTYGESIDDTNIEKKQGQLYSTNNIGLSNVYLRLLLYYGSQCSVDIYSNDFKGTTVHLTISYKTLKATAKEIISNEDTNSG